MGGRAEGDLPLHNSDCDDMGADSFWGALNSLPQNGVRRSKSTGGGGEGGK